MKTMEPSERDALQEWIERLCWERDTQAREIAELDAQVGALSECVGAKSEVEKSLRRELEEVREYLATSQTRVRELTAELLCRGGDLSAAQRNSELRGQKIMAAADILRRAVAVETQPGDPMPSGSFILLGEFRSELLAILDPSTAYIGQDNDPF